MRERREHPRRENYNGNIKGGWGGRERLCSRITIQTEILRCCKLKLSVFTIMKSPLDKKQVWMVLYWVSYMQNEG